MSENWNDKKINDFITGVKTGKIVPKSSGHFRYKGNPATSFSFPEYSCEIHVHWQDETKEVASVTHIKDLSVNDSKKTYPTKIVDTYTISMLRHFSGLDKDDYIKKNASKNKKGSSRITKLLLLAVLAIILIIIVGRFIKPDKPSNKTHTQTPTYEAYYTNIVEFNGIRMGVGHSMKYYNTYKELAEDCRALHKTHKEISPYGYCNFNIKQSSRINKNSNRNHVVSLIVGQKVKVLNVIEKKYRHEVSSLTGMTKEMKYYVANIEIENGQQGWIHGVYLEKIIYIWERWKE